MAHQGTLLGRRQLGASGEVMVGKSGLLTVMEMNVKMETEMEMTAGMRTEKKIETWMSRTREMRPTSCKMVCRMDASKECCLRKWTCSLRALGNYLASILSGGSQER